MSFLSNSPGSVTTITTPASSFEIDQPFHVDNTGGIAIISDPLQRAIQHLLAIALTEPTERPMRPTFGVGIQKMIFDTGSLQQFQRAAQYLQQAYALIEDGLANISVGVVQSQDGVYVFQVEFQLDQDPVVHQAVFNYTGQLIGST